MGLPLEELNERLWNWIDNVYHRRELYSLGTTPLIRWQRDIKHVRRVSPNIDLSRLFSNRHLNRAQGLHSADILPEHSHENSPNLIVPITETRRRASSQRTQDLFQRPAARSSAVGMSGQGCRGPFGRVKAEPAAN
jgi:hypothetical protein